MNDTFDVRSSELHIEVHKFRSGAIVVSTFLALVLQAFVPVYFPKFAVLDLRVCTACESASACKFAAAVSIARIKLGECCRYKSIIEFSSAGFASREYLGLCRS